MLEVFTKLADWLTYGVFGMAQGSHLAESVHFFIEDVTKIYALLAHQSCDKLKLTVSPTAGMLTH